MKRVNIKCPYCGARAFLRPASVVYGERAAPGSKLYVCGNYPACDSYVAAHRTSQLPMGTLADKQLRRERQAAHAVCGMAAVCGVSQLQHDADGIDQYAECSRNVT